MQSSLLTSGRSAISAAQCRSSTRSNGASARRPYPTQRRWRFMEKRAAAIREGSARECVWLLEHPPLFTAGTSADPPNCSTRRTFPVYEAGPRRPLHLSRPRPARRLCHARPRKARQGHPPLRPPARRLDDRHARRARRLRPPRARTHRHLGRRRCRRSEDRRARRAGEALGDASRICASTSRPTCRISAASSRAGSPNLASPALPIWGNKLPMTRVDAALKRDFPPVSQRVGTSV